MKKLVAILLVLVMALSTVALVACGNDTPDAPSNPSTPDTPDNPSTPSTPDSPSTPDASQRIELVLPERYYTGEDSYFHILEWSAGGNTAAGDAWIVWSEGAASDETGDLMSNAVFARNAYVEETYGVTITSEYVGDGPSAFVNLMKLDNQTNSNLYQLATMRSLNVWSMVQTGLYLDMREFEGDILHIDQPWWPQDAVTSFSLGEGLYVCATEMLLRDKAATAAVYFNTKIAENHGLNHFYSLVESGDWTLEDMISACDVVATSLDGDDLINSGKDMWGMAQGDDTTFYLFAAAGQKFAHIDEDGYLSYDFGSAESILLMEEIFENVMYADWYINTYINGDMDWPEGGGFQNDLVLFFPHMIKNSYLNLREMETEYGILPMPKYDAAQDNYCSLVWTHHDSTVGIPSATLDPEKSAIILEALSYEGYYTVTPVLYDTLLLARMAKSEESKRSLETIFETRVYDPGQYWVQEQGFTGKLLRHTATGTAGIATLWASYADATYTSVGEVNTFIDATR